MVRFANAHSLGYAVLALVLVVSSTAILGTTAAASSPGAPGHPTALQTLNSSTFVASPPPGATGPDDITALAVPGVDHGHLVIWTAYQNGVNPNGTAGSKGGPTWGTVVGYDSATGAIVRSINVTGKIDGITADSHARTLIATVNEDLNSAMDVIYPALGAVASYHYQPSPAVSGNGGTDSIAIWGGHIYVVHSNPNDTTQATEYLVTLVRSTLTAHLTPLFFDNSTATTAVGAKTVKLALTDPDTNFVMPNSTARFKNQLATIAQADGQIVFAGQHRRTVHLTVLNVSDNVTGNVPPLDGMAAATCGMGTLYVVDASAGIIYALNASGFAPGTVFVGEPHDTHNPLVGTLNLTTGVVTPFGNHFVSPKGLLFVPMGC